MTASKNNARSSKHQNTWRFVGDSFAGRYVIIPFEKGCGKGFAFGRSQTALNIVQNFGRVLFSNCHKHYIWAALKLFFTD